MITLWVQGIGAMTGTEGRSTPASLLGTFPGPTLREAVAQYAATREPHDYPGCREKCRCVDVERMTDWGCRLFDNEADARKAFG